MQLFTPIRSFLIVALFVLAGCGGTPGAHLSPIDEDDVAELAAELRALHPGVLEEEARRMAQIAYEYPHELAIAYQITDPPIIHNMKVNMGYRPRGLCYQWADDLQARMVEENFRSLELQRAIANADSGWLLDHSTLVITAPGDEMEQGIVLDPWRSGGNLYWGPVVEDPDFDWVDRRVVFAARIAEMEAAGIPIPTAPPPNRNAGR